MPWKKGTTIGEAKEALRDFFRKTKCSEICANCPIYPGGEGCCWRCRNLTRDKAGKATGCSRPNLSCLSCTCAVLDRHLIELERFEEFNDLVYGLPREGYRGCTLRPDGEVLEIGNPLQELGSNVPGLAALVADGRYAYAAGIPVDRAEEETDGEAD